MEAETMRLRACLMQALNPGESLIAENLLSDALALAHQQDCLIFVEAIEQNIKTSRQTDLPLSPTI